MNRLIILFSIFVLLMTSCEKEVCLNCNTYDLKKFTGDLDNFYSNFIVCENDAMWDNIVWWNENEEGGTGSLIDLNYYTVGVRHVENTDIDNNGVLNHYDDDIDGDGIPNDEDMSQYGDGNNYILELIICTNN